MNRNNTEDFIRKAASIHGSKYNYELVNYTKNNVKVPIVCKEHGIFYQTPANHLYGKGCPICGANMSIVSRTLTAETFINRAKEIHGETYDYTVVNYLNIGKPVNIICKIHGIFSQAANNHLAGQGCPTCGKIKRGLSRRSNNFEFIEKALKLHNNEYDYSRVNYTTNMEKVLICCHSHGLFYQTPADHLSGSRCPNCTNESKGWNRTSFRKAVKRSGKGTLYLIRVYSHEESFLKIGITSQSVKQRFRANIGKHYAYEIVYEINNTNGDVIYNAEKHLLKTLATFSYSPKVKFEGHTECFSEDLCESIISEIKNFLKVNYE